MHRFAAKMSHGKVRQGVVCEIRHGCHAVVHFGKQPRTCDMVWGGKIDHHLMLWFRDTHICSEDKPPERAIWYVVGN